MPDGAVYTGPASHPGCRDGCRSVRLRPCSRCRRVTIQRTWRSYPWAATLSAPLIGLTSNSRIIPVVELDRTIPDRGASAGRFEAVVGS